MPQNKCDVNMLPKPPSSCNVTIIKNYFNRIFSFQTTAYPFREEKYRMLHIPYNYTLDKCNVPSNCYS